MSSTRYVIGGIAIAGATYYIYQQRLEQTRIQEQSGLRLPALGSKSPNEGPAEHAGRHIDEAAAQAKGKFYDLKDDAGRKIDESFSKLEQEKAKASSWASDKLDEQSKRAQANADALYNQAKGQDTRGVLDKAGHEIKRSVYDAKDAAEDKLGQVKDKIVGAKDEVVDEVNQKKGWFTSKEDEVANRARRSVAGWSETAQQNADAYYDSLHTTAEDAKSSLFNWGSKKRAESESALNKAREEAQKYVDEAQAKFDETKASWFSFKQDADKKRLHEEASKQLEAAKSNLNSATEKLAQWKEQAKNAVNGKQNGLYDWLRGNEIPPEKEEALAERTSRALRGWGESAEIFARDEADEAHRRLGKVPDHGTVTRKQLADDVDQIGNEAQRKLNSWSKWADKKYDSTAQGAQEFYNDAQEAVKDAQKQVEDSTKSWYSWGSSKSKEIEGDAKKNLEDAQARLEKATNDLQKWGVDTAKDLKLKFWSSADDALHETKKGVDSLSEGAKDGLNDAQKWVKDQK